MPRCGRVVEKIEEADALNRAGECWCTCVNDDVPNARRLVDEGKCAAANSVIEAALRRCNRGGVAGRIDAIEFRPDPIPPITGEE
jgi:hypothetical protein